MPLCLLVYDLGEGRVRRLVFDATQPNGQPVQDLLPFVRHYRASIRDERSDKRSMEASVTRFH